jgi:hypothetical protein
MARHTHRDLITGQWASKPHKTGHRGGKSDMDREMEANSQESQKWNAGRWDEDQEINAAARSGMDDREDWKGRGNTVAGVYQGSQHRRARHGYDPQEVVAPSQRSNYHASFGPTVSTPTAKVYDARASIPENRADHASETAHEHYLTSGK